jgi:N-acetylmuramoyl-L-alanine amidase
MKSIKYLVVHSSATPPTMDIGAYEITKWHKDRNFRTIGYHYVIRRNGKIEIGRKLTEQGAHVKGHNHYSIGICVVGGVDKHGNPDDNFTTFQFQSLAKLLRELKVAYQSATIQGHRDFESAKTDCPSFDVKAWWSNINNEEAVKCQDTKHSSFQFLSLFSGLWKRLTSRSS